ncbi:unnamed protein product [Durusdinium trenchii]|uniref:Uncharacterized protein n=1 Tax=Durusdinium trenchii TaxID=1381693 RepID=A0ABP0NAY1_9DINO
MQRCKEVPNNLRKVLGLPKKFLQRRSTESNELSAIMPSALETAVTDILAERAERGEEINYHFVADVLKIGIEQYNHAVIKLKEELADPVKLLAMLEDHVQNLPEGASEECINKELGKARDRICSRLTEIGWRESSGNFVSDAYALESLNSFKISKVPEMNTTEEEAATLDMLRSTPMKDERQVLWAIQDGDDVATRQSLPSWMWPAIEEKVVGWVQEKQNWNHKIAARHAVDKELTPAQQSAYDQFVAQRSECALLFSMTKQALVTRVRSNADLDKLRAECFSIVILLSSEPEKLLIKTGHGDQKRLLLLQGEPTTTEVVPDCLASGGISGSFEAFAKRQEDGDNEEEEDDGQQEDVGALQEQMVLEAGEADALQILAFSDEEEDLKDLVLTNLSGSKPAIQRVKDFASREAYTYFEKDNLTQIPPNSCIGYHKTTRTWQGYFERSSVGLTFTHGGSTSRSEKEALLAVLVGLAQKHCDKYTRDRLWASQLEKLKKVSSTQAVL